MLTAPGHLLDKRCDALLKDGHWTESLLTKDTDHIWIPSGCMLHTYDSSDARTCLSTRRLKFLGDSTARQLFWAVARHLDHERATNTSAGIAKHTNISFAAGGAEIVFIWDPFLNETSIANSTRVTHATEHHYRPDVLVIGAGLWHVKHLNDSYPPRLTEAVTKTSVSQRSELHMNRTTSHRLETLFLPLTISDQINTSHNGSQSLTRERIMAANDAVLGTSTSGDHKVLQSYFTMVKDKPSAFMTDGIHVQEKIASIQAQVLLNYMCNDIIDISWKQSQSYCCSPYMVPHPVQKAILLGGGCLIMYQLLASLFRRRLSNMDVLPRPGTYPLGAALATLSAAILSCFVADRTALFGKESKPMDQPMFICLTALSLMAGFATCKPMSATAVVLKDGTTPPTREWRLLSREQTEEWKGWMQLIILIYHYFSMSRVLWIYQFIRVLVASYIFMTAWGHSMYFIRTNDFSFRRLISVLMRTNLMNVILAFAMNTQYDLYYFPVLSSLWFLIVWITIPRASSTWPKVRPFLYRLVLSITTVSIMRSRRDVLAAWLDGLDSPGMGILKINARELLFRFSLDTYIGYFGMLLAWFYSWYRVNSGISGATRAYWPCLMVKVLVPIAACVLGGYTIFCGRFPDKFDYNRWHPFISPLPVLAFVVLRNSTARASLSHSRLFAWFGRCSLETFVLQYHIWLAADTHGLLRLGLADMLAHRYGIRGTYWYNMLDTFVVFAIFLGIGHSVSRAMPVVVTSFLGDCDDKSCLKQWNGPAKDKTTMLTSNSGRLTLRRKVILALGALWILNCIWYLFD